MSTTIDSVGPASIGPNNQFAFQDADVRKLAHPKLAGVLIASEMGSGKTYVAIKLDRERRKQATGPTLVVCPKAVLNHWARHFELLTNLKVSVCNPKNATTRPQFLDVTADVYIVHWDALRLLPDLWQQGKWMHVIADEVHRACNRKAQQTKSLKKIKAFYRTGLSGTPVTNKPDQLWSILHWLYPREFSSYWDHYIQYVEWIWDKSHQYRIIIGPKNEGLLQARIEPYYVRHLKKEQCCIEHPEGIMSWLPDKLYSELEVDLLPVQRTAYNQMKKDMIAWIGENQDTPLAAPIVVAQLTRLQQFSASYATALPNGSVHLAEPSAKLDALMDFISDTDKQIVVFSQFKQLIRLLADRLYKANITHAVFTGDTPHTQRNRIIDDFQAGEIQVFAGTISAGGVGITLTASDTVVFLDRSWSPAINSQAEDRLHRIGQDNAVQVIDVLALNTIDRGRLQQIGKKWADIKRLLGD